MDSQVKLLELPAPLMVSMLDDTSPFDDVKILICPVTPL